jgi:urease accessory protein
MQRARGAAAMSVRHTEGRSRLATLRQEGCLKLRFPRLPEAEAVLVNLAGGLAGGDRLDQSFAVEPGAALSVTTQACERVYRSLGENAEVSTRVTLGEGAGFSYLPQETILFAGGRLARQLTVDAAADARLLLCESIILGREAMGEDVTHGFLADRWRIRRGGKLAFADDLRLAGDIAAAIRSPAGLAGNRAFATVLKAGPDVEDVLPQLRAVVGEHGGASLVGGVLVARLVARSGIELRRRLVPALGLLAESPLPRLWSL